MKPNSLITVQLYYCISPLRPQYSILMQEPWDIRPLRSFLAVAEAGSFSRAADRLGISQPSVSQQMRDLEAGLRVSLFQRRGKRILLTPRGQIFQEHAPALLRHLE